MSIEYMAIMAAIFDRYLFSTKFIMTPANTLHNARVARCESRIFCLFTSIHIVHKCLCKVRARGKGYGRVYKKITNKNIHFVCRHAQLFATFHRLMVK